MAGRLIIIHDHANRSSSLNTHRLNLIRFIGSFVSFSRFVVSFAPF